MLGKTGGDIAMVVHGAERVVVHRPMAPAATLRTTLTLRAVYDMKRLAQVVFDSRAEDEAGALVAETTSTILFRGEGGFGGEPPRKDAPRVERPREGGSTFAIEEATSPEQALLYRLSGDPNPLHADPEMARAVGFERGPILHGLATLGFMVRHAAKGACGGDASRITSFVRASFAALSGRAIRS